MKESFIALLLLGAVGLLALQSHREEIEKAERRSRQQFLEAVRRWKAEEDEAARQDKARADLFWRYASVSGGGSV